MFEDHVDAFILGDVDDVDDLAGRGYACLPVRWIGLENPLLVEMGVDGLEELRAHDAVVRGFIGGVCLVADGGGLRVEGGDSVIVENLVDEGGVVAGTEGRVAEDQGGAGVGVAAVEVVEDFGGRLPAAEDGDVVGFFTDFEELLDVAGVDGGVDYSWIVLREAGWDKGPAADGNDDVTSSSRDGLAVWSALAGSY